MNKTVKALVLDDNSERVMQVMDVLPDYIEATASRFEKDAQQLIAGPEGPRIGLLMMYADDVRARSLYIFDWLKKDADHLGLRRIPVIIYTNDSYSDRVMEFFEIDDVFVHEGEIDDHGFFSLITEALESADKYDDDYHDYEYPEGVPGESADADKSGESDGADEVISKILKNNPERLMGITLNAPTGANNAQRSMLIKDEDKIKSVIESIRSSKEKTYQLRLILHETAEDKLRREQISKNYYQQDLVADNVNSIVMQTLERAKEEKELKEKEVTEYNPVTENKLENAKKPESHIINTDVYNTEVPILKDGLSSLSKTANKKIPPDIHKITTSSFASTLYMPDNIKEKPAEPPAIKKVLVVDTNINTKLSLDYHYHNAVSVDFADSSMKAIDYFIQNKPDIVMIEYDMPYVNGIMILDSIRRQPNGSDVKAIILLDISKHNDLVPIISTRPGVNGVIYKPFVREQFMGIFQRCLS